jgi:glycosyltransferase involved in cell wall biosynthesis
MRILYLHGTVVPPPRDPQRNRFAWLSPALEGDILQEIWFSSPEDFERVLGPNSFPVFQSKGFRYHFLPSAKRGRRSKLALAWFFITEGLRIHREQGFDCVVAYSHTLTAICGAILKLLTGAKMIVEIVGTPSNIYLSKRPNPGIRLKIAQLYSDICLNITLWFCDRTHLLAPSLIAGYRRLRNVPASVFVEGIPMSQIPRRDPAAEQPHILLVGAPWYLKGADLLVRAFQNLAGDFPEVGLKLLGHFPDHATLDALIGESPRIELLKPRPNPEVLELIGKAMVFALPSRSEGAPLVILEAMASGVPVVASDVGGIPTMVSDGDSGFVVPAGDVAALENRLRRLLSDGELRRRMGARGYELAHAKFTETAYAANFTQMVTETVNVSVK